jgi:hypothetical protein
MPNNVYTEHYRGEPVEITTQQSTDGRWTAAAALSGQAVPSTVESGTTFATEGEARQSALSAAAAAMDRARSHIGKP